MHILEECKCTLSKRVLHLESGLAASGFPVSDENKMFNENVNAIPTQKINFK